MAVTLRRRVSFFQGLRKRLGGISPIAIGSSEKNWMPADKTAKRSRQMRECRNSRFRLGIRPF
ncbi:hypothetical protein SAMCFNEI73_pA0171 (plasmid) [Sinorhizobium americanum]|uniref:Uncharacterized protein n=1 Tax=Sinorhizobium americanum TaxID=194963 RepID=A0A1L3LSX6_9HYPH|nr:hypothetical protein SAMCFNEI73_pA0171 [Sinorhizobium americanum]